MRIVNHIRKEPIVLISWIVSLILACMSHAGYAVLLVILLLPVYLIKRKAAIRIFLVQVLYILAWYMINNTYQRSLLPLLKFLGWS